MYKSKNNNNSKEMYNLFPKSTKSNKTRKNVKTVERVELPQNAYSGNLKAFSKSKYIRRDTNSPAVPLPARSRFTSHSNRTKDVENKLSQDFRLVSKGINFEVEPFEKPPSRIHTRSNISQKRQTTYNEFMNLRLKQKPRVNTSEGHNRKNLSNLSKELPIQAINNIKVDKRFQPKKSRAKANALQKRVKSNAALKQKRLQGKL